VNTSNITYKKRQVSLLDVSSGTDVTDAQMSLGYGRLPRENVALHDVGITYLQLECVTR
jgi:hypothetical protein